MHEVDRERLFDGFEGTVHLGVGHERSKNDPCLSTHAVQKRAHFGLSSHAGHCLGSSNVKGGGEQRVMLVVTNGVAASSVFDILTPRRGYVWSVAELP